MKHSFLLLLIIGLFSYSFSKTNYVAKYTYKNKVKIGYAYNTFNHKILAPKILAPTYIDLPSTNPNVVTLKNTKQFKISSINLAFEHSVKPKLAVGGSFVTEVYKKSYHIPYKDSVFAVKELTQYHAIMASIYFHYLDHHLIDIYLGTDFGILLMLSKTVETNYNFASDRSSKLLPTLNFCPIGIQLKTVISPYLQVNIGGRGWIEGGLVYNIQ